LQRRPLAAQALGALGIVPDPRIGEFEFYLGQPFFLFGMVKDTP
jgi:hypothetical protein